MSADGAIPAGFVAEVGAKGARRTHAPVRKHSRPLHEGDAYFRPITQNQATLIMASLRKWVDGQERKKGKRWGPLTPIDIKVFETLLFRAMTWKTGKLDWSYVQIATAVRRSKQTVADSLRRLNALGFLSWIRRFEPVEDAKGRGPQVRQATNAYRVLLPTKVAAWLEKRRKAKAGPPPADHEAARAARAAQIRAMELEAQADASPAIARAQAKIDAARCRQERES